VCPAVRLSDFDFELPEAAIARHPGARRDASRLMVLDRARAGVEHRTFADLPALLSPGDLVVANDTRVLPARLEATKVATGGRVELLLVEPVDGDERRWRAMVGASKPVRPGAVLRVGDDAELEVVAAEGEGFVVVALPEDAATLTARHGRLPLPPYLGRDAEPADTDRYQTIFARGPERSVAAPTAGLHFTPEVLAGLEARGVGFATVTLHVGPGTFLPVRTDDVTEHRMHAERFHVDAATAARVEATRAAGGRVVAVGTTVTRVLETLGRPLREAEGSTDAFLRPGHAFTGIDALITNFHLPRSTLIMLVAALAGRERVLEAYRTAVAEGYRFFSYGDAMLIL
jgi:S-adenosylmethionine:tRNA ribosyltransferase-isomerase